MKKYRNSHWKINLIIKFIIKYKRCWQIRTLKLSKSNVTFSIIISLLLSNYFYKWNMKVTLPYVVENETKYDNYPAFSFRRLYIWIYICITTATDNTHCIKYSYQLVSILKYLKCVKKIRTYDFKGLFNNINLLDLYDIINK